MLPEKDILRIREELDNCKRPLFFFHDDADGLCSFLLFYRYKEDGKGVIIKTTPKIDRNFVRKVTEYGPDKVFILDIAMVEQDFLDEMKKLSMPVVWLDHHAPLEREGAIYFNPRTHNPKDDSCITKICYEVVKEKNQEDIWIAMIGVIGDWQKPDFWERFVNKYPGLLDEKIKRPEDALFNSKVGELVRIFSFVLKGKTEDVIKCMKILTRIKDPYEILGQTTPQGRFIYKRYMMIKESYDELLNDALKNIKKEKLRLFVFIYKDVKFSFSSEVANELIYKYPKHVIFIGREKSGEIKYSIRAKDLVLPKLIDKALEGIEGFGGGHEYACGAVIKEKDNKKFLEQFYRALGN